MCSLCFDKAGLGVVTSSSDQYSGSMPPSCHCDSSETTGVVLAGSIYSMRVDSMGCDDGPALGLSHDELWGAMSVLHSTLSFSLNVLSFHSRDFVTSCSFLRLHLKSMVWSCSSSSVSFRFLISLSRDWRYCCHHSSAVLSMLWRIPGQAFSRACPTSLLGSLTWPLSYTAMR